MHPVRRSILLFSQFALALFASNSFAVDTATVTLQPVPPQTVPPSSYPPGTTIVGQEIILGSVPARVWLEVQVTGWAPDILKAVTAAVSVNDTEQDGGGFSGANATCMGEPSLNAEALSFAMQSCNTNADCRMAMSGPDESCPINNLSRCLNWNGITPNYFPAGRFCEPWLIDTCNPQWIGTGIAGTPGFDIDRTSYGFAADSGQVPMDFHPSYLGTLVIDVPANAKGIYVLDFREDETFMWNAGPPGQNSIPIGSLLPAKITVLCGRCCYGVGGANTQCVEAVSANECATRAASAVFQANEVCPDSGGPPCPPCALDEHCDDGVFCNGVEVCDASGQCGPGQPPCESYEECVEATASCAPRIPTTTSWGITMMTIFLLIAAKLRYRPARRAAIGLMIALASTFYSGTAFAGATITLQPVLPQSSAHMGYPYGTTIVGQEITVVSAPARIWLEVHITGWAPETLLGVQAVIDGSQFLGQNAVCNGAPAFGGDIHSADVPCVSHQDCRNAFTIYGNPCPEGEISHCYGGFCQYGFVNRCNYSHWAGFPMQLHDDGPCEIYPGIPLGLSCHYGGYMDLGSSVWDLVPTYIGTLVVDVPANARGTYTIGFKEDHTYMWNDGPPGNNTIPFSLFPAKITIPCGRCCSGYASNQITCADSVGLGECGSQIDQVFTEGEACPDSGGPDCAECASDADCDDGIACTANQCSPDHQCFFTRVDVACDDGVFCNGVETCNPTTGCTPGQPPCEYNLCDESNDECRSGIPTVSNWGLVALALVILIAAKVRYRRELAF